MKAIRQFSSCSFSLALVATIVLLLASCEKAQSQTKSAEFTFPPIGTVQKVTDYAVRSVNVVTIFVWVYGTNNQQLLYSTPVWYGSSANPLTNKFQLDQQIIAHELTNVLYSICTNMNPIMDKNRDVLVYAGCDIRAGGSISYDNLYAYQTNQLVKNSNGTYSVPDLSSFSTTLNSSIPFYVPNLLWARAEVGYKGDSYPFEVDDELLDPESNPIGSDGFLYLSTDYITDSSSNNGDLCMKITLFDNNMFQIFNGDGNHIPETPMVLGMTRNGTNAIVAVNGGDSGRGYMLQWSSDLKHWTNSVPYFFSPVPEASAPQFTWPLAQASKMFFRTATTNTVPE